ncbi:unnamed protein product [Closterium sp. Yama58-4]|nr:unnamed protein product [Closterium sp. Yama58-4]
MLPRGYYGALKCVSRRWKAALEDEHLYSLREQLGRKESWVYVNVYHHPPPSATTASNSSHPSFRGGVRLDSLYAFSPSELFESHDSTQVTSAARSCPFSIFHSTCTISYHSWLLSNCMCCILSRL